MKINLWILIGFFILACGGLRGQESGNAYTGEVIPKIYCSRDTTLSYALYIPHQVRHKQPLPILFCFDPHGDGYFAVQKMVHAADSMGYVVCGSNNSKNGQQPADGIRFFSEYLNDLQKRVRIDPKRVYCCGFSGGARVASAIGLTTPGICGVIGCGAGFPGLQRTEVVPVDYLGICGNADPNLSEMQALMEKLDHLPIPHHLLIFDGIHAWPEGQTIQDMFNWMEIRAIYHHLKEWDSGLIRSVEVNLHCRMQEAVQKSRFYKAALTGRFALYLLDSLIQTSSIRQKLLRIEQDSAFQKEKQWIVNAGLREQELQQHYLQAMGSKSHEWWQNEILNLRKAANDVQAVNFAEPLMNRRLLAWLSLAAYSQANRALQSGTRSQAQHWIDLYKTIDPENPEPARMLERLKKRKE